VSENSFGVQYGRCRGSGAIVEIVGAAADSKDTQDGRSMRGVESLVSTIQDAGASFQSPKFGSFPSASEPADKHQHSAKTITGTLRETCQRHLPLRPGTL
jgi:hypothetical protein